MKRNKTLIIKLYFFLVAFAFVLLPACKKLVSVDPPVTQITGTSVYNSDATATAVLTGLYTDLSRNYYSANSYSLTSFSLQGGLSSDELTVYDQSNPSYAAFHKNNLAANTPTTNGNEFWTRTYQNIFICNSAIEGLSSASGLTPVIKTQLMGEAKFLRAYLYFYLVNLYGDVPIAVTSDYKINSTLSRSPIAQVYNQIISDLLEAKDLLNDNYVGGDARTATSERVRPNKWAASALLARVYLYTKEWGKAEAQATSIISNVAKYDTVSLNNVFFKTSKEAIWQLQPVTSGITNTQDAYFFIIPTTGPDNYWNVYLNDLLVKKFEPGDMRKSTWVSSVTINGVTYFYPYKYKVNSLNVAVTEYLMILRLAEQYLIRAEAEAYGAGGGIPAAIADLNLLRRRAGLTNYTGAAEQASVLAAIAHERQVELFTELGHRWFDLKRTGAIDSVMNIVSPLKGGTWRSYQQYYPIPIYDISKNSNLVQNSGY